MCSLHECLVRECFLRECFVLRCFVPRCFVLESLVFDVPHGFGFGFVLVLEPMPLSPMRPERQQHPVIKTTSIHALGARGVVFC